MIGHLVRVIREGAEPVDGILHARDATGVRVWRQAGLAEQDHAVFVPMGRIVEIVDRGRAP